MIRDWFADARIWSGKFTGIQSPLNMTNRSERSLPPGRPARYSILSRIKAANIPYGATFDSVGVITEIGEESGARGVGPTIYFNDPNNHLLEIRTYER